MRESFGGAFMIKLVLVFIVVYVSFMAVAVNYAKTFRVKNGVINRLEQSLYQPGGDLQFLDSYLDSIPYNISDINGEEKEKCETSNNNAKYNLHGVCVVPMEASGNKVYYKVTTYISIDFPFFDIKMTLPISGETKSYDWSAI